MQTSKLLRRENNLKELRGIILAARGELKSDIIVKNANLVDVVLGDIREKINIAVWRNYVVRVGYFDIDKYSGPDTLIIDASSSEVITPGFIDPHVHIESSLLRVTEFSKLALMNGTTTVAADPHEIANVLGIEGIKAFIEESKYTPLRLFFYAPSCVPPVKSGLTKGFEVTLNEVRELLNYKEVIGLGEVMDFLSIINGDEELLEKISLTLSLGKVVDGHAPQLPEDMLVPYAAVGIRGDHESVFMDEALSKLRSGMRILIREGSAWRDLEELSKILTYMKINTRYLSFSSDDLEVVDLVESGHMNRILRKAVSLGIDPITAVQMATINAAEYLGINELGSLTPGKLADIVILKNFRSFQVQAVIVNGELVVSNGRYLGTTRNYEYPKHFYETIKTGKIFMPEDFKIKIPKKHGHVRYLTIRAILGKAITKAEVDEFPIIDGYLTLPPQTDHSYVAVIDRHHSTGRLGLGIIKGLGILRGAIAQTIAHDVHNIIVIGKSHEEMSLAVKELTRVGGGIVSVLNDRVLGLVELPIAGLISDKSFEEIYTSVKNFMKACEYLGVNFHAAFMTISLLSLPVIPEVRITEHGVFDVMRGTLVNPILDVVGG
ncbi:MAG: adenine deaminase [Desulfurococcaceae archaeon TW002]